MTILHVAANGSDTADGSADRPFRTINRAAALAQPGDTVVVHEGEYREWVRPRRGGLSDQRRITYEARRGRARRHQGLGARSPAGSRRRRARCGRCRCPTRCSAPSTRSPRRSTGDWIVYPERAAAQASRRRLPERASASTRSATPGGGVGPAAAHRGARRLDRVRPTAVRDPGADPARLVRRGRRGRRRRSGRTSRAPTRTRSSSRSTCAARSSTRPSTTSTTSPCAASSSRRPPARGRRRPPTSPA